MDYIANYFQEFEDAVYAPDGINPATGKRFDEYFSLTSLAKKYVLEEFVKNIDADRTSQFFYKPADNQSKIGFCGPVWDYDNAFDNFKSGEKNNGMFAAEHQQYLYYHLCLHDFFMEEVKKQWNEVYSPLVEGLSGQAELPAGSLRPLSEYYELLRPSAAMNYSLWPTLDTPINNNYVDTGSTFEEHFNYLQDYLLERSSYLNMEWME